MSYAGACCESDQGKRRRKTCRMQASRAGPGRPVAYKLLIPLLLLSNAGCNARPTSKLPKFLTLHFDTEGLERSRVMKYKTGKHAEVQVLDKELGVVSCKGQVFNVKGKALLGCGDAEPEPESQCGLDFEGCAFWSGTCVWDSMSGHVSMKPYCLRSGLCVPHGPGPAEKDTEELREHPHVHWAKPEGAHIVGGTLDAIVVLTQPQWGAYYHFLIDSLTRFYWVKEQFPEVIASNSTYFHVGMVNEVGQAWARLWGLDTSIESNRLLDGWWSSRKFYIPPSNACAEDRVGVDVVALKSFQGSIRKQLPMVYKAPLAETPTILMVRRSRTVSRARVVTNWSELENAVREAFPSWKIKIFSDEPPVPHVTEVCRMFAQASIILGVHGAGFANLVCSRKNAILIELQQTPHSWDYQLLSMKLGLVYLGVGTAIEHLDPGPAPIDLVKRALGMAKDLAATEGIGRDEVNAIDDPILKSAEQSKREAMLEQTQGPSLRVARVLVVISATSLLASFVALGCLTRGPGGGRPGPSQGQKGAQVIGASRSGNYKYSFVANEES